MKIWKVSHGDGYFSWEELKMLEDENITVIHQDTKSKGQSWATQGENYLAKERQYDIFYSCFANNSIRCLGVFLDENVVDYKYSETDKRWKARNYQLIKIADDNNGYTPKGHGRWWKPNDRSTFIEVPQSQYIEFEQEILPFFKITMADLLTKRDEIIKEHKLKLKQHQTMQKYITLLKANKNLVLTGAPGTGKTYLAKKIAKELIKEPILLSHIEELKIAIKDFVPNQEDRANKNALINEFQSAFPMEKIADLTLDEYCTGKGEKGNFCWWMEKGLASLGLYTPAQRGSFVFGIFFSKEKGEYIKNPNLEKYTNEEALEKIKQVVLAAISKENDNLSEIFQNAAHQSYLERGFVLKIMNMYGVNGVIPIHSLTHLKNVIKLLDIKVAENATIFELNHALFLTYQALCKGKDINPFEFMELLYKKHLPLKNDSEITQQTITDKIGEYQMVQFHPAYDYTDFVEGLRPVKKGEFLGFELKNGVFKDFCKRAKENPTQPFVFIIDEINRGEMAKILGDLFFAIDPGYRGKKGAIQTQYANIQTEETIFDRDEAGNPIFYVPENVYIIGTMNDIDRSVESFDFAMRRRFAWYEVVAEERKEMWDDEKEGIKDDKLKAEAGRKMTTLNKIIEKEEALGTAFHIGPAYFLKLNNYNGGFQQLWDNHIHILLKEYVRGLPNSKDILTKLENAWNGKDENNGQ